MIFKVDVKVDGFFSSVVEYEVYHPISKEQLNLTFCKDIPIQIHIPVKINTDEIFKHDPSSNYYNDICSPTTSEYGTDMILKDRQNEYINKNLYLCENFCTFKGYNKRNKKVLCECSVKTAISELGKIKIDKEKLLKSFLDAKIIINFNVMKCIKLLFTKDGFIYNMGNYIMIPILFFNIIISIIFRFKGYNLLKNKIKIFYEQFKEYLKNNNNGFLAHKNIEIYNKNEIKKPKRKKRK